MRQKFFLIPFAAAGDRAETPDAQQPDGSVSYSQGYGPDYSADPATVPTAKPVPRANENGVYYDVTDALRALQTQSAPEFITAANNGGSPFAYDRGVAVRWSANGQPPFATYVSRVNNNTAVPSNTTNWSPLLFEAASNAQALAGSSSALIITPAALQYVLTQTSVSVPAASYTQAGTTRYATNAEAQSGSTVNAAVTPSSLRSALTAYPIPASQVQSGTLDDARIPALAASKTTSGTFALARIPSLPASQIGSGTLADARIPPLAIAKTTGLQAALDAKFNRAGGVIDGTVQVNGGFNAAGGLRHSSSIISNGNTTIIGNVDAGIVSLRPLASSTTNRVDVGVDGSINPTGGFDTGSSRTVKDIEPTFPYGLAEVLQIDPIHFRYTKAYRDDDRLVLGFPAEDVRAVLPEAVRDTPDAPSPLALQAEQLVPVLWRGLQELADEVRELRTLMGG